MSRQPKALDPTGDVTERWVTAEEFITAPGKTVKEPDELVVLIEIPNGKGQGSAYFRQGTRRQLEIAVVAAAAWLHLSADGQTIQDARVSLGAVGPTPLLARKTEQPTVWKTQASRQQRQ